MIGSIHYNVFIWLASFITSTFVSLCGAARNKIITLPSQDKIPLCTLKTTSTFCEFSQEYKPNTHLKNEKWALIASVILKSKESLHLEKLTLQWQGKPLHHINAALYSKKESDKQVIPIEDNLICDGSWDEKEQKLTFLPDKKITAVNELYLVLSYPQKLENKLKKGKFVFPGRHSAKLLPVR